MKPATWIALTASVCGCQVVAGISDRSSDGLTSASGGSTQSQTSSGGTASIGGASNGGSAGNGGSGLATSGATGVPTGGMTAVSVGGSTGIASGGVTGLTTGGSTGIASGGVTGLATGGATANASGGATSGTTGGVNTGGLSTTGGTASIATGGTTANNSIGGATGGTSVGTGGTLASGGASGSGGATSSGGSAAIGGTTSTGGASADGTSATGGTGGQGTIWRILPLGDGITASTCYRAKLWQKLIDSNHSNFDFIGTFSAGDPCSTISSVSSNYDKDHQGLAGLRASDVLKAGNTYVTDWFSGHAADIVLMQMGGNDVLNGVIQQDILDGYSTFLTGLRNENSKVRVFIALLMPMGGGKCGSVCQSDLSALNTVIPIWAAASSTSASPVSVVDLYTGFDITNTTDGVKPDEVGSAWLADRWHAAISPYII